MKKLNLLLVVGLLLPLISNAKSKDGLACNEITDGLCRELWNKENQGQMKVYDGEIKLGQSKKSEVRLFLLEDLKALIDSLPRLPEDMKERAAPILSKMSEVLAAEDESHAWLKRLSDVRREFNVLVTDVIDERQQSKYPELYKLRKRDLNLDQTLQLDFVEHELADQILEAKYKEHPNWKRVESVFDQVKEHLTEEVEKLTLPEEQKAFMLNNIKTAKLTLPYNNPARTDADAACGTTTVNAFYSPSRHQFTICAGLFNAFPSEASLYFVTAHEIGHSIDAERVADHNQRIQSKGVIALSRLVGSKDKIYSCEDWEALKKDVFVDIAEPKPLTINPLESLYRCIAPNENARPFETRIVKAVADNYARYYMSENAGSNNFVRLAQPKFTKDGEIKENEFYLRPDRIIQEERGAPFDPSLLADIDVKEIFLQELLCQNKQNKDGETKYFTDLETSDREDLFAKAMENTQLITQSMVLDWLPYCGLNCRELSRYGMSEPPNENFADWIAGRAFKHYLEKIEDMNNRRSASALSTALFCDEPGPKTDAPGLAEIEKQFSLEPHPDGRVRRISLYNDKVSEVLECISSKEEQGYGACEPQQ